MEAEDRYMIGPLQLRVSQGLENLFLELAGTVQWLASYFINLFLWTKQMTHKLSIVYCCHSDGATDFVPFFSRCHIYVFFPDITTRAYETCVLFPIQGFLPVSNLSTSHDQMLSNNDSSCCHKGIDHMSDYLIVSCVSLQRLRTMNLHLARKSESTPVWRAWKTMCWETGADQRSPTAGWNTR